MRGSRGDLASPSSGQGLVGHVHPQPPDRRLLRTGGERGRVGDLRHQECQGRSKVEMPPLEWNGRRCRLVWRSRGFPTKSKDRLWQEQRAEWYPQPVVVAVSHVQGSNPEGEQAATMKP